MSSVYNSSIPPSDKVIITDNENFGIICDFLKKYDLNATL